MAERERMSAVDAAWLRMDEPTNLMMIVGVMIMEGPLDLARLRRAVARRFLRYERFRQRPVDDTVGAHWEADPDFDLDAHVRRAALPSPAGKRELESMVSDLTGQPLDPRRPLWQFHLVENYAAGAAVIVRIHHCYADGIALTRVFSDLTDPTPPAGQRPSARRPSKRRGRIAPALPGGELLLDVVAGGRAWLARATDMALHPEHAGEFVGHALGGSLELLRLATLPDDPATRLRGPLGRSKLAAWGEPLPLAEVRTVAHLLGCTINDVLMSAAAGAIGGYLRAQGDATDGLVLRATVPVNLRDPGDDVALGNRFGLVFLDLPVGVRDPLERTRAVSAAMARLKDSYQPVLVLGMLAALGTLGEPAEKWVVHLLSSRATVVASNVRGPGEPVRLAGRPISQMMFWVPQSGGLGVGLSILSYAGSVQFGLIADRRRIRDPRPVARRFAEEFESILLASLLGPYLRLPAPGRARVIPVRPSPARRRAAP